MRFLKPAAFRRPESFRARLEAHHATATELIVRCYKSHARQKGVSYPQAVDEALCFGWIDGVRRALDEASFSVRFSPRKAKSGWSKINVKRARELLPYCTGMSHTGWKDAFQTLWCTLRVRSAAGHDGSVVCRVPAPEAGSIEPRSSADGLT